MEEHPVLEIHRLSLRRGRRWIYRDFDLRLDNGVTALLGPNGAGKTTLIESLLRPENLRRGSVLLRGQEITTRSHRAGYRAQLGFMPQHWRYFSGFTALESVEYVAWLKRVPRDEIGSAARAALAWVGLLDHANAPVRKISGGMRQRVGLAEALVNDPALVLLDEPTVGLDPAQRASFRSVLTKDPESRAVLISTHLTEDVRAMANRVVVVNEGTIAFDGSPSELAQLGGGGIDHPEALEAGYLSVIPNAPAVS